MKRMGMGIVALAVVVASVVTFFVMHREPAALVLTGIVTTNDVIVSPQIAGKIVDLLVKEGATVTRDQLLATIAPGELRADTDYYGQSAAGATSQVQESEAELRYQLQQTTDAI